MTALPNLWFVLKIMFYSTVCTVGILLPITAVPIAIFLLIRYIKKSNKNKEGDSL